MKKILIVEDDSLIAELERDYLEASGYATQITGNGIQALEWIRENTYDLILLDIMLPGLSGFEICRAVRKEQMTPIIMITAKREDIDKIRGLGFGADDYMVKPFSPSEMVARVKTHIRIHEKLLAAGMPEKKEQRSLIFEDLRIDPLAHKVYVKGTEVFLPNKEYELLLFLAEHPDIVFSKDTLFDRIWGMDAMGETATVTVHINRIREKIEENPSKPHYIETVRGAGYRFRKP